MAISFSLFSLYGRKLPLVFLPKGPHFSTKVAIYRQERVAYCAPPPSCTLSLPLSSLRLSRARAIWLINLQISHQPIALNLVITVPNCSTFICTRTTDVRVESIVALSFLFCFFFFFHGPNAPNAAPMLCLFVCLSLLLRIFLWCRCAWLLDWVN